MKSGRFFLVGLSHKTASVEWRERFAIPDERLPAFLTSLRSGGTVSEAVLLSTCNRVELYAVGEDPAEARAALSREFAASHGGIPAGDAVYVQNDEAAARHLFRVAAGLDSLVVGESEILGQVKRAYELARRGGCTGKLTNVIFQRALYVGKRVRTETGLSEGPTSVAGLAVALAGKIFGNLKESRVLLLGAGKMAELSARCLLSQKVSSLTVMNRTVERARGLAEAFGGRAASLDRLREELLAVDIVICSTGSPEYVVRFDAVAEAMRLRRGRSLFFIDIAVPRDVDSAVHKLENVYLYNVDDLQSIVAENLSRRQDRIEEASRLVETRSREFSAWYEAWQKGKTATLTHTQTLLTP